MSYIQKGKNRWNEREKKFFLSDSECVKQELSHKVSRKLYKVNSKKKKRKVSSIFTIVKRFTQIRHLSETEKFWLLDRSSLTKTHTHTHTYSTTWIISTSESDKIPNIIQEHTFFGLKLKVKKQK